MITGANGEGKSTLFDVITFGLFGKPFRKINKGQLINTKNNRDLLVEIEFGIGVDYYKIRRGMKPDVFEVYKNGELQNQPNSNRDYQQYLNTQILRMDYQIFTQIVMVGKAQHVSFMKLDSAKRRLFVESILGLLVFTEMNKIHTSNMSRRKEKTLEIKSAVSVADEKVKIRKKYIENLEQEAAKTEEGQALRVQEIIEKLQAEIQKIEGEIANLVVFPPVNKMDISNLTKKVKSGEELIIKFQMKIDNLYTKSKNLLENVNCSSCGQEIPKEQWEIQVQEVIKSIEECKIAAHSVELQLQANQARLEILKKGEVNFLEYTNQKNQFENQIRGLEDRIDDAKNSLVIQESSHRENIIKEKDALLGLIDIHEKLLVKRAELADKAEYDNLINTMLKDGGIKSVLIKRFIKIINQSINTNLAELGFFAKFTLDENFDETIQARGIDTLSYNNFSEGEKLRIDMAILLAWREVAKFHSNVSTNLLAFDEVLDGSLDAVGTEALANLLNKLRGTNLFIVTHSPDKIADKVRSQISFQKVDGFSQLCPV